MIVTRRLAKRYRKGGALVEALQGLDLEVSRGEFLVLRGRSGSGKTTLLNLLAGLARPSAGEVEVAGARIDRMSGAEATAFRAGHVGVVFQLFHLIPYLDLLENTLLPVLAPPAKRDGAEGGGRLTAGEWARRAEALLEEFGLGKRLRHVPGELSAGERQRAAIARAILRRPEILLADEPTGNLDPESARGVLDCIKRFHGEGGTVLLVTHHELPGLEDLQVRTLRLEGGCLAG